MYIWLLCTKVFMLNGISRRSLNIWPKLVFKSAGRSTNQISPANPRVSYILVMRKLARQVFLGKAYLISKFPHRGDVLGNMLLLGMLFRRLGELELEFVTWKGKKEDLSLLLNSFTRKEMEHRRHLRERFPHLVSVFNQQVSQVITTTLRNSSDGMTWKT